MTITINPAAPTVPKSYDQSGFEIVATPIPVVTSAASSNPQPVSSANSALTTLQKSSKGSGDSSTAVLAAASTQSSDPQLVNSADNLLNHINGSMLALLAFASMALML